MGAVETCGWRRRDVTGADHRAVEEKWELGGTQERMSIGNLGRV